MDKLPVEMINHIFAFVLLSDLGDFFYVSKRMNKIVTSFISAQKDDEKWKKVFPFLVELKRKILTNHVVITSFRRKEDHDLCECFTQKIGSYKFNKCPRNICYDIKAKMFVNFGIKNNSKEIFHRKPTYFRKYNFKFVEKKFNGGKIFCGSHSELYHEIEYMTDDEKIYLEKSRAPHFLTLLLGAILVSKFPHLAWGVIPNFPSEKYTIDVSNEEKFHSFFSKSIALE